MKQMEKIISLILSLLLLLSCAACGGPSLGDGAALSETGAQTGNGEKNDGEIKLPEGFSVGFGRADMTPEVPVTLGGHTTATKVSDKLFATCVAVSDGENTALLFHMDMKDIPEKTYEYATRRIQQKLGIAPENVILTATHTHSSPHTDLSEDPNCIHWYQIIYNAVAEAAEEAMRDLALSDVYTGTGDTTGFAFVRRYLMADGSYQTNPSSSDQPVAHETEADPELRVIRFDRGEKKDVVLVNWQAHAAHAVSAHSDAVSSDFIHYLREGVEKDLDADFAYFNGASGNINLTDLLGNQKHAGYDKVGKALVDVVKDAVRNEEKVESGSVVIKRSFVDGNVTQDSAERRAQAAEWAAAPEKDKGSILAKYSFQSQYEAIAVNTRAKMDPVTGIPLSVISFGDVAICANPFEYFDTNAKEIRDASPFKMTFTCGYSNGSFGYMPAEEVFPHGGYEVYVSRFEAGTAEKCAEETLRMLRENKEN